MESLTKKTRKNNQGLTSNDLDYIERLSPSRVSSPKDLQAWSNQANWEEDRWPQQPGRYQFLGHMEQHNANPNWPYFEYEINDSGFRGAWPNSGAQDITLLLGCSFTFGEGLDKPDTFWGMLDQALPGHVINLGVPGAGHTQIAELLWAAARAWPGATRALITWPNITRFHYITEQHKIWPIHPHQDHAHDPNFVKVYQNFWSAWSDASVWHQFARSVELAELVAQSHSIKLHHGTWGGGEPMDIIRCVSGKPTIPFAYAELGRAIDVARDGHHPGRKQNSAYADLVLEAFRAE